VCSDDAQGEKETQRAMHGHFDEQLKLYSSQARCMFTSCILAVLHGARMSNVIIVVSVACRI
jgi:hypothetical protein